MECRFAAAHFYKNPEWSAAENRRVFGRCYTEHGHGHNYRALFFLHPEDLQTPPERSMSATRQSIHRQIDKIDHEHLNFGFDFFRTHIPTTENIAKYLWLQLKDFPLLEKIELYEMDDLWVSLPRNWCDFQN